MIMQLSSMLVTTASVLALVLVILLGGAMFRLLKGPAAADRFVALDMLTGLAVAMLALVSVLLARRELLDVALGVASFSFLGTVAVGAFLERHRGRKQ